jgi:hypothetical protein
VQTLLAAGANTHLRNTDGLAAADIARLTGDTSLTRLFD